jgi:hypothetical protein
VVVAEKKLELRIKKAIFVFTVVNGNNIFLLNCPDNEQILKFNTKKIVK